MMNEKPLKILQLTTHLNVGGISTYVYEASAALSKRGHTVEVLSAGGELEDALRDKAIGVRYFSIRTKNILSPKLFFALPKIVELVRRDRFDLLHAHTRVTQALAALVSFFTKVPFVSTAHGFYRRRLGRKIYPAWGKRVIAISPLVAEELEKTHRVPFSKIRIIFNAIDILAYRKNFLSHNPSEIRRRLGIGEGAFVIGSVSRLVRDKGHEVLVEAVASLKKKHTDIFLLIVGDGRERKRLEGLVRRHGLDRQSALIPSTPDTSELLSVMDVFAHPATFREGFGLAMLEAMVAKVPVVATNIWAINSIIRNHVNGFLVEPKNARELENALKFILENPEAAGTVAKNAYETACQAYSIERFADELETVYKEVVDR